MLLAAGLGTRLRPLTDSTPKALVEVAGTTMLERIARRLVAAGADRLIINTHHHAEAVERFVAEQNGFGVETLISREEEFPLETGGGLLHARTLFRGDAPFFLHNTDILADFPLPAFYAAHREYDGLATLAVMERETSRFLLFDEDGLCGRADERLGLTSLVRRPRGTLQKLAFAGVHVIDPAIFGLMTEEGAFSVLESYTRLAADGLRILPFRVDRWRWLEIGNLERLEAARRIIGAEEHRES
jgi:N-acetyl-alpha-D-muramate 1-phosphate uridylyltransferase